MPRATLWIIAAGVSMAATALRADEITIAGYEYKNVLISKTSSFYYVQLPDEGRTLSIPVGEVQAATVKINNDPFYRTPLKEKYDQNRERRAAGEIKDVDPAFRAAGNAGSGSNLSLDDLRGGAGAGGGGGGGLGVPRTMVEGQLSAFGFQVEAGPSSATARQGNGTTIELMGPPETLTGVVAKINGPVAAVDAGAQQMRLFIMQVAPGAVNAFAEALNEAKTNGTSTKSAGGVTVSINRKVEGENATAELRIST